MNEPKRCFAFYDDGIGSKVIFDSIDDLMSYLKTYIDELPDDGALEIEVERHDMTEAQYQALPEYD